MPNRSERRKKLREARKAHAHKLVCPVATGEALDPAWVAAIKQRLARGEALYWTFENDAQADWFRRQMVAAGVRHEFVGSTPLEAKLKKGHGEHHEHCDRDQHGGGDGSVRAAAEPPAPADDARDPGQDPDGA